MKIKSQEQIEIEEKQKREEENKRMENPEEYNKTLIKKVQHFWTYEKWKVIIPILCLIIVVTFVRSYLEETKELSLCIAMVNARMSSPSDVIFEDRFAKDVELDIENYPIRLETGMIHPEVMDAQTAANPTVVASVQKYQNFVTTGIVDVTISDDWMVAEYEKADSYLNLKECLPNELYQKLENKIVSFENQKGEKVPVGIRIENYPDVNSFYENKPILVISASSERIENAVLFVEWLEKEMEQ